MDSENSRLPAAASDEKRLNLPFGYRFGPTSVELIGYYLIPMIKGEDLPSDYVVDLDGLYQYDPHQLPFKKSKHVKENEAYFFTLDPKKNTTEESQTRTTPNGYWKVYEDNLPVDEADEVIGFKTKLFHHDVHGNKTHWKMIEYRPHPSRIPTTSTNKKCYIVCKIKQRLKE